MQCAPEELSGLSQQEFKSTMKQGVHILLCAFYALGIWSIEAAPASNITGPGLKEQIDPSEANSNRNSISDPVGINASSVKDTDSNHHSEDDLTMFEGDIKISKQTVLEYYNFSSVPGGEKILEDFLGVENDSESKNLLQRSKRGATSYYSRLWPNNQVRYRISSSISGGDAEEIRRAVDHWEEHTCLNFLQVTGGGDYIEFVNTGTICSSWIGRIGGRQEITLPSSQRCRFGNIVHEIGHAVGFGHEQSRPDRDNYVHINFENVKGEGEERSRNIWQFMKRNHNEVNSLGSTYDYGSIMHYPEYAFSRCSYGADCKTISINNNAEYQRQGRPRLGQRTALSTEDINQANILYGCLTGRLRFYVKYACHLKDTDGLWNNPDPYVKIQAKYGTAGSVSTQSTPDIGGTTNPSWYKILDFGCTRWHYFEIQVWDADGWLNADDAMSDKELVIAQPGNHYSKRHNAHGHGYLIYSYYFTIDGNECWPNPCLNGGTCIDECASYRCLCPHGRTGTRCEHPGGRLRAYARYGRDLPDEDGWWNDSDPYVEFIGVDNNGNSVRLTTSYRQGEHNPTWNQRVDFGYRSWRQLRVRVYDADNGADDPMSNHNKINLYYPGISRSYIRHNCYSGYIMFDYSYL